MPRADRERRSFVSGPFGPFALWLLLLVSASGCLPRDRFNKNCEWTGDTAVQLDLRNPRDAQHLVDDAQLAEELRVRYADFQHKAVGSEGHGGLLDGGRVARACQAKLDRLIADTHGVTTEDIDRARQHRDQTFDVGVILSFALVYVFGAMIMSRLLSRRLVYADRWFRASAAALASVGISSAGIQFFSLWATTAEMIRVGNDHIGGSRAARMPWNEHFGALFAGGMLLFWLAWLSRPSAARGDEDGVSVDGPRGVLLR
jgi:hypothetical protein